MQRRNLLGLAAGGLVLSVAGCAGRTDDGTVIAGISARAARELARANSMINQRPLSPAVRRSLERGRVLPPEAVFHTIPPRMIQGLPTVEGHEWRAAGIDLLLVHTETQVVVDILRAPLR